MNEAEIQNRLWKWRNQNHRFIVPNVYMPWGTPIAPEPFTAEYLQGTEVFDA